MAIGRAVGNIVGICLGAYVFAATIPGAITAINDANTTGWTTAQAALWPVVGIIILFVSIATMLPDNI